MQSIIRVFPSALTIAVLVAVLSHLSTTATAAAPATQPVGPAATLHGDSGEDHVRLAWEIRQWQPNQTGFDLKRRPLGRANGGPGAWEKLNTTVLKPSVATAATLSVAESDPAELQRLQAALDRDLKGRELANAAGLFKKGMAAATQDELKGLRFIAFINPDRPLFLGLGFVDRNYSKQDIVEYGLFPAYSDGRAVDAPVDTYQSQQFAVDDPLLKVQDLTATRMPKGARLDWHFSEEKVHNWSIFGFHVYRADVAGGEFKRLTQAPVGGPRVAEQQRHWVYVDTTADPSRPYVYAVAPRNIFGREFTTRTVQNFDPANDPLANAAKVNSLVFKEAAQTQQKTVRVRWDFDAPQEPAISGFVVERADLPAKTLNAVSEMLPPNAREFVDVTPKKHGNSYAYRVTVMGKDGPLRNSSEILLLYMDRPVPPAPKGLTAERVEVQGKPMLRLKWLPKTPDDKVTAGYQLYADSMAVGEVLRQASIPRIQGTEFYWSLENLADRPLTVGIAAVSSEGQEGERTDVTLSVGGRELDSVASLTATPTANNSGLTVKWEYPKSDQLLGFRISCQGTIVANEKVLGPTARSWDLKRADVGTSYTFEVVAVTRGGTLSQPRTVSAALPSVIPGAGINGGIAPASPTDFKAEWLDVDGKKRIRLRWSVSKTATVRPAAYLLAVDDERMGQLSDPKPIAPSGEHEFLYSPPAGERTYTFSLVAVADTGNRSLPITTRCMAPGRSVVAPKFSEITEVPKDQGKAFLWKWKYDATDQLKGFRIYRDGQLLIGEDVLGKDSRQAETPPAADSAEHKYELEAVGIDGSVSERGKAIRR